MPEGHIVSVENGSARYRLGSFLKAGLIGVVYPGVEENSGEKVAVKVPAPNLSADAQTRFEIEHTVLTKLAERLGQNQRYVPWIKKGTVETTDSTALILEYVGEDRLLSSQLPSPETPGLAREKMALRAAVQYVSLLEKLHELEYTCQDRKLADLRWLDDPGGGRLVVLDWNVVEEGTEKQADDLYLFGVLWYQLLTGRYPSTNLNALADNLWREGSITYGTRRLLAKASASQPSKRFQSATELRQSLQKRIQLLAKSGADLLAEAQPLHEQLRPFILSRQDTAVQPDFQLEWHALDLFDLAYRQGEPVEAERGDLLRVVNAQGQRLISQIKHEFLIPRYDEGERIAQQATAIAKETDDAQLQLNVARWRLLVQAGQRGLSENVLLKKMGLQEPLVKYVERLEEAPGEATEREWENYLQAIKQDFVFAHLPSDSKTADLLGDLQKEMEFRLMLCQVRELEFNDQYADALRAIVGVKDKLSEMIVYQAELQAASPDLSAWQSDLAAKTEAQRWLNLLEKKTSSEAVVGKPYHLEYLLTLGLRNVAFNLREPDVTNFEKNLEGLSQLRSLYRICDYAIADPTFWPEVVRAAFAIVNNKQLPEDIREEAGRYLQKAENKADFYFNSPLGNVDELVSEIYRALLNGMENTE